MEEILLNNGIKIPTIAIGPGMIFHDKIKSCTNNKLVSKLNREYQRFIGNPLLVHKWINNLSYAFECGYRLLDNSATYNTWPYVIKSLKRCGLKREDIIMTTRIDNRTQIRGTQAIRKEVEETLKTLKSDYIDILQFHWPVTDYYINTWLAMEELYKEGKCRAIGVANCHQHHLETIMDVGTVVPAIDQFEVHPLFTQKPLVKFCTSKGIQVQAYTPIARYDDRLMRLPVLKHISQKYNKTLVQIILRWHIQNGLIPITRSSKKSRIKDNISIFDFSLTDEEMKQIDGININARVRYDPDNCDFSIL